MNHSGLINRQAAAKAANDRMAKDKGFRTKKVLVTGGAIIAIAAAAGVASIVGFSSSSAPLTNAARAPITRPYTYNAWQPSAISYLVGSEEQVAPLQIAIAGSTGEAEGPVAPMSVTVVPEGGEHDALLSLVRAAVVQPGTGGQAGLRILDLRTAQHSIPEKRSMYYLESTPQEATVKEAAASGERNMLYEAGLPDPFHGSGYFSAGTPEEEAAAYESIASDIGNFLKTGAVDLVVVDERMPLLPLT
jgi:hypothetical protein